MTLALAVTLKEVSAVIMAVGAIIAIIGAIVVYRKWSSGEPHIEKYVMAWVGGIVMLILIQAVIISMFN